VERGAKVRLIRDNVVIHEGTLSTLKRFKDEVKEVQVGQECGMAFENYQDMRAGDVIECFRVERAAAGLWRGDQDGSVSRGCPQVLSLHRAVGAGDIDRRQGRARGAQQ
jgi:hypothetical protein